MQLGITVQVVKVTDGVMGVVTGWEVVTGGCRVVTGSDGGLPNSGDGR